MTPAEMAHLHAAAFPDGPRPWGEVEFAQLLADCRVLALTAPEGFALGRVAGPEAELLTLAIQPETRRQGVGRALVASFEAAARTRGAREAFLEVAETNAAARALYAAAGYACVGRRPGYVGGGAAPRADALVLRKPLA